MDISSHLKGRIHVNKLKTLQESKENIRNEIRELNCNPEILQSVINNILERAQKCETQNGQHLKDIFFYILDDFNFPFIFNFPMC